MLKHSCLLCAVIQQNLAKFLMFQNEKDGSTCVFSNSAKFCWNTFDIRASGIQQTLAEFWHFGIFAKTVKNSA